MSYFFSLAVRGKTLASLIDENRWKMNRIMPGSSHIPVETGGPESKRITVYEEPWKYEDVARLTYAIAIVDAASELVMYNEMYGDNGVRKGEYSQYGPYWFCVILEEEEYVAGSINEGYAGDKSDHITVSSEILRDAIMLRSYAPLAEEPWTYILRTKKKKTVLSYGDSLVYSIVALNSVFRDRTLYEHYGVELYWPGTEREAYDIAAQMAKKYFIPRVAGWILNSRAYSQSVKMKL